MVNVWDIHKQYCTHCLRGSKGVVNLVAFHPDHAILRLYTCAADCSIRIWDLKTSKFVGRWVEGERECVTVLILCRCVMVLKSHVSAVTSLGFSADGQTLLR